MMTSKQLVVALAMREAGFTAEFTVTSKLYSIRQSRKVVVFSEAVSLLTDDEVVKAVRAALMDVKEGVTDDAFQAQCNCGKKYTMEVPPRRSCVYKCGACDSVLEYR